MEFVRGQEIKKATANNAYKKTPLKLRVLHILTLACINRMKKGLVEEYKELTATCIQTDYSNKASVRQHNKAVTRMYKIVDEISKLQTQELINQFIKLLNIADNKTNIWAAIQMLEKLNVNGETEAKALSIIRAESEDDSADALGYQIWLNTWTEKKI